MSSYLKFRRYKKKQGKSNLCHPKLIVGEDKNKFNYMGLTSTPSKGKRHNNLALDKNPEKGNPNKSYLRKHIDTDKKNKFGKILENYELSNTDFSKIKNFLEKNKKN